MAERTSDRWISLLQSVLLHGAVVGSMAYAWWIYRQNAEQPAAQEVIEAVVVDASALESAPPPAPKAPPEPDTGPPSPTPEQIAERKAQEQQVAEEKRVAEERQAAELKEKEAEAKRAAEQQRLEEAKRRAEEKKKAEEARARSQREQELRRSLEQEERVMAARASGALANWRAQITARIQRAWLRPPSAKPGIDCVVYVTQIPGGEVTNVRVGTCNGDQAVRESIEAAVYRASPLPPPADAALFERNLEIRFKPID